MVIRDPFLFCNPVDKNGEGIRNPDDHLACYRALPSGQPPTFPIPILNFFIFFPYCKYAP